MLDNFAISTEDDTQCARMHQLADAFHLRIDHQISPRLNVTADRLELISDNFLPLFVDFSRQALQKRREAGKNQGLIRACKPAKGLRILDATAGWGRDAALLASFGAEVLMLERQPIMAALLSDALTRMSAPLSLALIHSDAIEYLTHLETEHYPDVIYIDPMHPERQKSALVKKNMQVLQRLFGPDEDVLALITEARTRSRQRVVVKWPQRLPPLVEPDRSVDGKTVRFDVYLGL